MAKLDERGGVFAADTTGRWIVEEVKRQLRRRACPDRTRRLRELSARARVWEREHEQRCDE